MAKVRQIKLNPDEPCPLCQSGRPLRFCCVSPVGTLRIKSPDLSPRLPLTGRVCSGCYLSATDDCSDSLTGEHYMSRSILKQLGQIVIGGYPWLAEGATKQVGINALTANILCGRHNSVLSVLDTDAGRFFEKVENTRLDMNRRSLSTKPTISYFSGENLERWMLKVFCGLFYAKVAAAQEGRLIDSYTFNRPLLFRAMLANVWEPGCGLYFNGEVGRTTQLARSIAAAPLLGAGSTVAVGIQMKFAGLRMLTLFDPAFSNSEKLRSEGWLHRVSELKFNIQRRSHLLVLTWPPGTPAQAIHSKAFSALRVKLSDEFR